MDRNYGNSFNQNKATPVFSYVWDGSALITGAQGSVTTGAWRPDTGGSTGGGTDMTATNAKLDTLNAYNTPCSRTCSTMFTGSLLAKASAGEIHSVFGYCSGASQYLRVYDGTNVSGSVIGVIAIPSSNNFSIDYSAKGAAVSNGIFVALSSSSTSHVATGADAIITIVWK